LEEFKEYFEIAKLCPMKKNRKLAEVSVFLAKVSEYFKYDLTVLENYIIPFLEHYATQMNKYLRKKLTVAIMILRSKNLILPLKSIFFLTSLLNLPDKDLRKMIISNIINDIKRINKHHQNVKINKQI